MDDPFLDPILARWDAAVRGARSDDLPSLIARTGTVLRDGAPAEVIDALEARLGTRLPPSYRAFLERSDGAFAQPGWGIITSYRRDEGCERDTGLGLLDCSRVGWFRDRERSYVDIWADTPAEIAEDGTHSGYRSIPEQQYLDHERHRDSVHLKSGHVRYALQISSDIDGYTILLNPLVVDPRGEWEAWDFGSKLPGAIRYRSFAALLAADAENNERQAQAADARVHDIGRQRAIALDAAASPEERLRSCHVLMMAGARNHALDALLALAAPGMELSIRREALRWLGSFDDQRATGRLLAAAREPDVPERMLMTVVGPLAARDDREAREAAIEILIRPELGEHTARSVTRKGADVLWESWHRTGNCDLLIQLAYCADARVVEPLARTIVDPAAAPRIREWLVRYAAWPGDPAVIPALREAAERDLAPLQPIGEALERLGARDDAIAVFERALAEADPFGQVAQRLSWTDTAAAGQALLARFLDVPTPALARALGWFPLPGAAAALVDAAAVPELRLAAIDGLERMPGSQGLDALAALTERGDVLAVKALARRRDPRALAPLLALLFNEGDAVAWQAADGLRDLRDPEAASALLAAVRRGGNQEVIATAAHALVSMRAPEAAEALELLRASADGELRRLGELWA